MFRTLTKDDVAVLRRVTRIVVCYNHGENTLNSVCAIIDHSKYNTEQHRQERHEFNIPVALYKTDVGIEPLPAHGVKAYGHISLFPPLRGKDRAGQGNADSVVEFLKAGDRVRFVFRHHWLNNGYVAAANLHGDALFIEIERGTGTRIKFFAFEMDYAIAPNNSARMVKGIPDSQEYHEEQVRMRREYWHDLALPPPAA